MKKTALVLFVAAVLAMSATPAYALSSITNSFSLNDYSVSTGQTIRTYAKTVADHMGGVPTNPYPTNFMTEVSSRHFNKPVPYSYSGTPNPSSWTAMANGEYVDPCYHYYSGEIWIANPKTIYMYCNATIKSAAAGTRYGSRHGQDVTGTGDSSGNAAWVYTTHN